MFRRKIFRLRLPSRTLVLGKRTLVMGILNVTPDSFSDGGLFYDRDAAVSHAFELESAGADIIDIGGESTRPGSKSVPAKDQLRRIMPVLEKLHGRLSIPISVDTGSAEVADAAVAAGAEILNDVTGLHGDAKLAEVASRRKIPVIVMHMRGEPRTMQKRPFGRAIIREVTASLLRSVAVARSAGIARSQIVLDPGIGFGKSYSQDYELIARLPELSKLGFPLLVGTSRKKFIGRALGGRPVTQRLYGTAATVTASILGGAHIVRVHDVVEMIQVARVSDAVLRPQFVDKMPRSL